MTDQVDKHNFMHKAVADLAQARADKAIAILALDALSVEIAQHVEKVYGEKLQAAKGKANAANIAANRAEQAVREMVVQFYYETQDKKPHPAVGVRVKTIYVYDPKLAVQHCVETRLVGALSLKRSKFEQVASVTRPDFVVVDEQATATIKTDLSAWLPRQEGETDD